MLQKLIQRLPQEIIDIIITYSYQPQNKYLLADIRNYYYSKKKIMSIYNYIYKHAGINSDIEWIINDIFAYMNNYYPIMKGYLDKFNAILLRSYNLSEKSILRYIAGLETKPILTQINILWGLFNIDERNEFISKIFLLNI